MTTAPTRRMCPAASVPPIPLAMIRQALAFHTEALIEDGDPAPEPAMSTDDAIAYHCESIPRMWSTPTSSSASPPPTTSTRSRPQYSAIRDGDMP